MKINTTVTANTYTSLTIVTNSKNNSHTIDTFTSTITIVINSKKTENSQFYLQVSPSMGSNSSSRAAQQTEKPPAKFGAGQSRTSR
jgi:hypothetical protein